MSDNSVIWKFTLQPITGEQFIEMPRVAEVLTAREQGNDICVWAKVFPNHGKPIKHRFWVHPTGREDLIMGAYLGTAMFAGGGLVLHVFHDRSWVNQL